MIPGERPRSTHRPPVDADGRRRVVHVAWVAVLSALLLASSVAPAAGATAGTMFVASQETVVTGTSDGINRTFAEDGLTENLTEVDAAPDPIVNPVNETVILGTRVSGNVAADVSVSDDAYVRYRESPTPPTFLVSNAPLANDTSCQWSTCAAGMASDNASASSATDLDVATYRGFGFALPADAANFHVEVGYEAFEPSGNDRILVAISWDGGASFCPEVSVNLPGTDPNAFSFANLTACTGHLWSGADFSGDNIVARFTHTQAGGATETIFLDANVVRVTYETGYRLDVRYGWSAIPAADGYVLWIEGGIADEDVFVEVLTPPATWNGRVAFTNPADRTLSWNLTVAEYNGGSPSIRFLDALGPDDSASEFRVDVVEVVAIALAYRLDVRQDVTGVSGSEPILILKGLIRPAGDTFNVDVWNFTSNLWNLRVPSAFGFALAFTNVTLSPEEVGGGVVRVRYTDVDPANSAGGQLRLDLVAVVIAIVPAPSMDVILIGGGAAGSAAVLLILLVVLRRKSVPAEARGLSRIFPRTRRQSEPDDTSATRGPPKATDLESGESYVVEDESPARCLKLLEDLTRIGRSGLFLTGRDPRAALNGFKLRRTRSLHVAQPAEGEEAGSRTPSLERLFDAIQDFLKTNPVGVVLIDGADFLTERNEPRAVSRFLLKVADSVSNGQQIFLVSMSPAARGIRELRAVRRRMAVVRPT